MNTQKQIILNVPSINTEISDKTKKVAKKIAMAFVGVSLLCAGIWGFGGYQASENALNFAQLNRNQVSAIRFDLDIEHFVPVYEVEWYLDRQEQEFKVHALTGEILEADFRS